MTITLQEIMAQMPEERQQIILARVEELKQEEKKLKEETDLAVKSLLDKWQNKKTEEGHCYLKNRRKN